ncbi:MAG: spermidine synthase [Verrucomicrobiota bacterium]|jgi:predicted membrane-bound spermidine synthase
MRVHVERQRASLALVLLLFFGSGFAAVLYQTIWQRMLGFFSGVDVYSVTITVAAFMAGLGCGSLTGGYFADRFSAKSRLLAFAAAEAIIALFALGSKWLYYDFLYGRCTRLADTHVLLAIVLFASLLLPTFCMGMTLPILAKTFTAKIETASAIVGGLYGVNTLGAAFGALVTGWVLFPRFAFDEILRIGAGLNAVCAVGAILVWRLSGDRGPVSGPISEPIETAPTVERLVFPIPVWMLIYALSGFVALSLEILWFRMLGVIQKSASLTFPTLLAVYLSGLGLGAILGSFFAWRVRRPAVLFLTIQSAATAYAAIAVILLFRHVDHAPFLQSIWNHLGNSDPADLEALLSAIPAWLSGHLTTEGSQDAHLPFLIFFVLPFTMIAPSTFLMGFSFPVLQKLVQNNPSLLGRRVGWLQTLNIVGCMLGAVLTGWLFLRWLGSSGTLKFLVAMSGLFLCLSAWHSARPLLIRLFGIIAAVIFVSWIAAAVPTSNQLWAKLHGAGTQAIIAHEGESGLCVVKGAPSGFEKGVIWILNNGLGQSWLPYGRDHTQIGMLAALLHPNPEDVAVIGLGSGDTLYASGGSPKTRRLTCIEIVESNYAVLKEVAPRARYAALSALLQDTRIEWLFTDGRAYIQRSRKQFDVIEADALRPHTAYSGNLYSCEYFRTAKDHLKPGGFAITWAPTDRVLSSFFTVFRHGIVVGDVAIGSDRPIEVDMGEVLRRLSDPFTSEYYRRIGTDVQPLVASLATGNFSRFSPDIERLPTRDLNSDLFPRDEYNVPEER